MSKIRLGILLSVLVVIVGILMGKTGLLPFNLGGTPAAVGGLNQTGPIKIGAALGLTGYCAEWGNGELKSVELVIEETNKAGGVSGRNLELITEDTQCDPRGSVNAINKLVNVDKVEAVIGLTWGDSFQAGYTNNAKHIVSVSPSTSIESLLMNKQPIDYVFSTWVPMVPEIETLQKHMERVGVRRVILLHDQDPFGLMVANTFKGGASTHGINVIEEEEFPVGYDDFKTAIVKIKEINPDGVFVAFQSGEPKAKFLKQARELGLKPRLFSTEDIQDFGLLREFGLALEGVTYVYPIAVGDLDSFLKKFKEVYGTEPSGSSAANAYDAARVVIAALEKHHENGADLKTAVEETDLPGTVVERIKFGPTHQITGVKFQIKTIKNGGFVVLE